MSALQVEAAPCEHPTVAEAAVVVGIPHPVLGRVTDAAIITRYPVTATTRGRSCWTGSPGTSRRAGYCSRPNYRRTTSEK